MQLSNDNVTFTPAEPFAATRTWTLAGSDAVKTVYVRYLDRAGNVSQSFRDTITLDSAGPVVGGITATPNPFSAPSRPDDDSHPGVGQPLGLRARSRSGSSTPPAAW